MMCVVPKPPSLSFKKRRKRKERDFIDRDIRDIYMWLILPFF